MKKNIGFVLGLFLVSQYAVSEGYTENDSMDDATNKQGAVEQFEQTLQDSPTAAGLADMEKKSKETTDQAKEPMDTDEESDMMSEEEPMTETPQP